MDEDSVKLLKECDAGIKMGISSLDEVMESVHGEAVRERLMEGKNDFNKLESRVESFLKKDCEQGKEPAMMAKAMSWIKTNVKLAMDEDDKTVADLITDGCNMGIKSVQRYINKYPTADERVKSIARDLMNVQEKLAKDMRAYL